MILSRERIAELRRAIDDRRLRREGRATPNQPTPPPSDAEILALLDAYEAQLSRPASEPPSDYDRCLFLVRGEKVLRCGEYQMGQWWTDHDDGDIPFLTPAIECWWPLPKRGADE